ncbi:NAD(P)H nitroreductase [Colwellia sp. D2M02]|uniref:Putative NAD(P)H nitroreductase n=1 Tax=Colwellia asteriadis TaxID=517723 RepID=A0ABN1L7S6_9GAMM|nr:NAD(P)H nitroreductase [Colwellia sp. D2M02]MBU2892498.1 NAD(P)H nitroreductase [Colwellia sp. D2M02]
MNAIEMLLHRQSTQMLCHPAPKDNDLDAILSAGMRAPDHGALKPWHFTVITGQGLQRLSEVFVQATHEELADEDEEKLALKIEKVSKKPFRAPMIIVISTKFVEHKVPKQEQLVTAGCCAHAMQMAAYSLGYGAMWRTGGFAYNPTVKKALGISNDNEIVGYLYIGSPTKEAVVKPAKPYEEFVTYWD